MPSSWLMASSVAGSSRSSSYGINSDGFSGYVAEAVGAASYGGIAVVGFLDAAYATAGGGGGGVYQSCLSAGRRVALVP